MSELTVDSLDIAKTYQWEIEQIEDPVDAALEANRALSTLNQLTDERFQAVTQVIVRSFGAYALRLWSDDRQEYINLQYEPSTITGESAGMGFVQNIIGNFQLKTLFIGIKDGDVIEGITSADDYHKRLNIEQIPRLVVPVLEIDSLQKAA